MLKKLLKMSKMSNLVLKSQAKFHEIHHKCHEKQFSIIKNYIKCREISYFLPT